MKTNRKRHLILFFLSVCLAAVLSGCGDGEKAVGATGESLKAGSLEAEPSLPAVNATVATAPSEPVKAIALTFDDGPDTGDTKATNDILDSLEKTGSKPPFS